MPALAEVIPFPPRRSRPAALPRFSAEDEAMTSSLICMLADEMATWGRDGSASARIYFYVSFHHAPFHRWMRLLTGQETVECRHLARKLDEAFRYVSSTAAMDSGRSNPEAYSKRLNELADHLRALLLLIQAR
jgi:hypothetical protein